MSERVSWFSGTEKPLQGLVGDRSVPKVKIPLAALVHDLHPLFPVDHDEVHREIEEDRLVVLEELVELPLSVAGVLQGVDLGVCQAQEIHLVDVSDIIGHQDLPVFHDAHPVGKIIHVVNAVRDEEDCHPLGFHLVQRAHDFRQIRRRELFQRFVQDEEPGPFLQSRKDGDEDPVGEVEVLDDLGRVQVEALLVKECLGLACEAPLAEQAAPRQ